MPSYENFIDFYWKKNFINLQGVARNSEFILIPANPLSNDYFFKTKKYIKNILFGLIFLFNFYVNFGLNLI